MYRKRISVFNYLYNGSYDAAIEFFSDVLKKGKFNIERIRAHCHLAEAYAGLGNTEQSKAHLQMALELGPELFTVKDTQRRLQNKDDDAMDCPREL